MKRLNYHHLLYFWTVARYSGLSQAAEELLLTRSTLSAQIHQLEETFGHQLIRRSGRKLTLTDTGQVVFEYCDKMFSVGRELGEVISDEGLKRPRYLRVGVADVIPRLIVGKLLKPLFSQQDRTRLVCREDHSRTLLAELATHNLDLIIGDAPISSETRIKGHSHRLGASGVALFGTKSLAARYKAGFPRSLEGAPILLSNPDSILRADLDRWFESKGIRPRIVGEFDDRDLLEVFGQMGAGIFPAPVAIRRELAREYGVTVIGHSEGLEEQYFAITLQRQVAHPSVQAVMDSAVGNVFT